MIVSTENTRYKLKQEDVKSTSTTTTVKAVSVGSSTIPTTPIINAVLSTVNVDSDPQTWDIFEDSYLLTREYDVVIAGGCFSAMDYPLQCGDNDGFTVISTFSFSVYEGTYFAALSSSAYIYAELQYDGVMYVEYLPSSTSDTTTFSINTPTNQWNTIVFRVNSTSCQFYLNGELVDQAMASEPVVNFTSLGLEWISDFDETTLLRGLVFYDRPLTDDEIDSVVAYIESGGVTETITRPTDIHVTDIVNATYLQMDGTFPNTTPISSFTLHLPVPSNQSLFSNANIAYTPLPHTLTPAKSFNTPLIMDGETLIASHVAQTGNITIHPPPSGNNISTIISYT